MFHGAGAGKVKAESSCACAGVVVRLVSHGDGAGARESWQVSHRSALLSGSLVQLQERGGIAKVLKVYSKREDVLLRSCGCTALAGKVRRCC